MLLRAQAVQRELATGKHPALEEAPPPGAAQAAPQSDSAPVDDDAEVNLGETVASESDLVQQIAEISRGLAIATPSTLHGSLHSGASYNMAELLVESGTGEAAAGVSRCAGRVSAAGTSRTTSAASASTAGQHSGLSSRYPARSLTPGETLQQSLGSAIGGPQPRGGADDDSVYSDEFGSEGSPADEPVVERVKAPRASERPAKVPHAKVLAYLMQQSMELVE